MYLLSRSNFLFVLSFIIISLIHSQHAIAQIGCPSLQPVLSGTDPLRSRNAWQKNASLVVNIIDNPTSNGVNYAFSSREKQAIEAAFASWSASLLTCANVTATRFISGSAGSGNFDFSGQYISFAKDTLPSSGGTPTLAENELASTGVYLHHASIYIDVRITSIEAFKKTVAHEIGHSFGLRHCTNGTACGSVMDNSTGYNDALLGSDFPLPCDITAAKTAGNYCPTPSPSPSPSPSPTPDFPPSGGCNGRPDFDIYPDTGCAPGFVYNGTICTRSPQFASNCAMYRGYDPETCSCNFEAPPWSPIVIDVLGDGFAMTDSTNGVNFDLDNDGAQERLSWTAPWADDSWLVYDRNNNGTIDNGREMFGNVTPQPPPPPGEEANGFLALAEYDTAGFGGNGDGKINHRDLIFDFLKLWQDSNHNGISELQELKTLPEVGLRRIDLDYRRSRRTDEFGNQFRYKAKVRDEQDAQLGRWAWDVFLVVQ